MNLYWDRDNQEIIKGLSDVPKRRMHRLNSAVRDRLSLSVYLVTRGSDGTYTVADGGSGSSVMVSTKKTTLIGQSSLPYSTTALTRSGSGEDTVYSGTISFNITALITAIGTSTYIDCTMELVLVDADTYEYATTQVPIRFAMDIYQGSAAPAAAVDNAIMIDGDLYLKADDGKYYKFSAAGSEGTVRPRMDQTGVEP